MMDLLAAAAEVIHRDNPDTYGTNRVDAARLLFDVVDRLTFRLWNLPINVTGNQATVELQQAGTDVTFTMAFRRIGDKWFIVPPLPDELRAKRAELIAARDPSGKAVNDPYELRSPRDTLRAFIMGMVLIGDTPDNPAYRALDTSQMSEVVRNQRVPLLALYLKDVIDRAGYITWQEIPDDPNSRKPYVHYQHARGDILVAPVETDNGVIWQFTPETLRDIQAVHAEVGDMPLPPELADRTTVHPHFAARNLVAANTPSLIGRTWGLERWQWLALVLMVVGGLALGILARAAFLGLCRTLRWERLSGARGQTIAWGLRYVAIGGVFVITVATAVLGLQAPYPTIITAVGWTLIVIGFVPVSWQLLGALTEGYRQRRAMTGRQVTLVSLTTGITRFAVVVAALLLLAHVLAIPYQNVIAGLGIGGLAVALAAQPMLQNFLSGLSLYADKPLAVGDFCRYGDKVGTIENIGARSTRIRSLDRPLITIPNSEFANMQLENFSSRDRMWLITTLQVRYETTPDQLRYLLTELRRLLIAHPKVSPDPARVRFAGFGQYSLDLEIFAYVLTADYNEFLAVREDVFLRMMIIVKEAGTDFAFPSHVEYHAKDEGIPAAKIQEAEAKVAQWRAEGRLPFPDVDWHERDTLSNTLDYPPQGSVLARDDVDSKAAARV